MDQNKTFIRVGNELIYFGNNDDNEMYLFDPHINSVLFTLTDGSKFGKNKVAYSQKYEQFVTQSYSKSVLSFWSVGEKRAYLKTGTQEKLECLALNADQTLCFGGSINGVVFVWNTFSGEILTRFQVSTKKIFKILVNSSDMILVVITSDAKASIFNLDTIKYNIFKNNQIVSDFSPYKTVFCHNKAIVDAYIPKNNDEIFLTASKENYLAVWDIRTGDLIRKFIFEEELTAFCIDELGNLAYVGFNNGTVTRCKVGFNENKPVLTMEENEKLQFESKISDEKETLPVEHKDFISAIACVGDCNTLITAGGDQVINFCNLEGEVKRKNQKIKKIIDYFGVIERPLSLFKSSLSMDKVQKKQEYYTSFKKVKQLKESNSLDFPCYFIGNAVEFNSLNSHKITPEFVNGLVKFVCKREKQDSGFKFNFNNKQTTGVPDQSLKNEMDNKDREIAMMKERIQKLVNMNKKLIDELNDK